MGKLGAVVVVAALAFGCTRQERGVGGGTHPSPSPDALQVSAILAAVTLADDCPPPTGIVVGAKPTADIAQGGQAAQGACGPGGCGNSFRRMCQQTTMQLTLRAGAKGAPTTVKIVRVELEEIGDHTAMGFLTPRSPRVWTESGNYQPWNGTISAGQSLQVMFDLSSPEWHKIGGRWLAQGKTFRLRVTMSIDGVDSTVQIEQQVESPEITIEPPVVT